LVSGAVYAELLAEPERNGEFVDRFFAEVGIAVEWEFRESGGRRVRRFKSMPSGAENKKVRSHDEFWQIF
jgi:hypothetical protein